MNVALAAAATLVSLAFMLSTLDRFLRRRRPHEFAWTVALGLFALGSGALWWAEANGWSLASFRVFYLAGAILNVPWLALGTVYLLSGERRGRQVQRVLVAITWLSVGIVLFAPTRLPVGGTELPTGKEVCGGAPRLLAAVGSGVSAVYIIGGALWSAWRVLRHRNAPGRLAVGNVLIALGTLILSASGTLAGRLGKDRAFAVTLLAGIIVLFAGFLVAPTTRRAVPRHADPPPDAVTRASVAAASR
ncbi:MAG: hypothetical protein WEB78_04935 [Ilumatobacteraceae bacterium]